MKKIIILIPVYNDWESLNKLLEGINENIKFFNDIDFECLIVNDASTTQPPKLNKPSNFQSVELLNMKENKGHARCNAFGIRHAFLNKNFDNLHFVISIPGLIIIISKLIFCISFKPIILFINFNLIF